jgi:hypothetical protein
MPILHAVHDRLFLQEQSRNLNVQPRAEDAAPSHDNYTPAP